jgi:hypothetical protein
MDHLIWLHTFTALQINFYKFVTFIEQVHAREMGLREKHLPAEALRNQVQQIYKI